MGLDPPNLPHGPSTAFACRRPQDAQNLLSPGRKGGCYGAFLVDNHAGVIAAGTGNARRAAGAVHGVGTTGGRRVDAQGSAGSAASDPVIHKRGTDVAGKAAGGLAGSCIVASEVTPRVPIAAARRRCLCRRWCWGVLGLGHRDRAGIFILILSIVLGRGTGVLARSGAGAAIGISLLELTIGGRATRCIILGIGHEHDDHGCHRDDRHNGCDNRGDRGATYATALLRLGILLLIVLGRLLVISTVIITVGSRHIEGITLGIGIWRGCPLYYSPRRHMRCSVGMKRAK